MTFVRSYLLARNLTYRQIEVCELVIDGLRSKEIADKLCVEEKTVKWHLSCSYKALGVRSRAEFITLCLRAEIQSLKDAAAEKATALPRGVAS